jgi:hypothetical protein
MTRRGDYWSANGFRADVFRSDLYDARFSSVCDRENGTEIQIMSDDNVAFAAAKAMTAESLALA